MADAHLASQRKTLCGRAGGQSAVRGWEQPRPTPYRGGRGGRDASQGASWAKLSRVAYPHWLPSDSQSLLLNVRQNLSGEEEGEDLEAPCRSQGVQSHGAEGGSAARGDGVARRQRGRQEAPKQPGDTECMRRRT